MVVFIFVLGPLYHCIPWRKEGLGLENTIFICAQVLIVVGNVWGMWVATSPIKVLVEHCIVLNNFFTRGLILFKVELLLNSIWGPKCYVFEHLFPIALLNILRIYEVDPPMSLLNLFFSWQALYMELDLLIILIWSHAYNTCTTWLVVAKNSIWTMHAHYNISIVFGLFAHYLSINLVHLYIFKWHCSYWCWHWDPLPMKKKCRHFVVKVFTNFQDFWSNHFLLWFWHLQFGKIIQIFHFQMSFFLWWIRVLDIGRCTHIIVIGHLHCNGFFRLYGHCFWLFLCGWNLYEPISSCSIACFSLIYCLLVLLCLTSLMAFIASFSFQIFFANSWTQNNLGNVWLLGAHLNCHNPCQRPLIMLIIFNSNKGHEHQPFPFCHGNG